MADFVVEQTLCQVIRHHTAHDAAVSLPGANDPRICTGRTFSLDRQCSRVQDSTKSYRGRSSCDGVESGNLGREALCDPER